MPVVAPKYGRAQVDQAGSLVRDPRPLTTQELRPAIDCISNWRAAHALPLGKLSALLRRHATAVSRKPVVSQRLKRFRSVASKLFRSSSRLSQMQDIAGCRAVVETVEQVREVVQRLEKSRTTHELVRTYDYLTNPKSSGYRSYHLVYRFNSSRYPEHCGMLCEAQVRTRRQHAWATAVEVTGFFRGEDLKDGKGDARWLRFFYLVASGIAMREGLPALPDSPDDMDRLQAEAFALMDELDVVNWLGGFEHTLKHLRPRNARSYWYLIQFDAQKNQYKTDAYGSEDFATANAKYREIEAGNKDSPHKHVVLVSSDSFEEVKQAYPSFFSDTRHFRSVLMELFNIEIRRERKVRAKEKSTTKG